MWIAQDIHLLRLVAHKIAYKLYRSSYNRGARLFYPPTFLFLDYMLKFASTHNIEKKGRSYPSENERRNPGRTGHDCKNHQPNHHKTERRRPY